jgi:hypothetical protein
MARELHGVLLWSFDCFAWPSISIEYFTPKGTHDWQEAIPKGLNTAILEPPSYTNSLISDLASWIVKPRRDTLSYSRLSHDHRLSCLTQSFLFRSILYANFRNTTSYSGIVLWKPFIYHITQGYLTSSRENCSTECNPLITSILLIDWILECSKL